MLETEEDEEEKDDGSAGGGRFTAGVWVEEEEAVGRQRGWGFRIESVFSGRKKKKKIVEVYP